MSFEIVPAAVVGPDEILEVIAASFDAAITPDWYRWKHLEAPWGRSEGWVARDDSGVIGVRLFTPWALRIGSSRLLARRAMDGATLPQARRRGVFESLVKAEMKSLSEGDGGLLMATPAGRVGLRGRGFVWPSQRAYAKSGWTVVGTIPYVLRRRPGTRAAAAVAIDPDHLELPTAVARPDVIASDWDSRAISWRIDPRSGRTYELTRLLHADEDHGLIARVVVGRRARILVVEYSWGRSRELRALVGATARARRCKAVLEPTGSGAPRGSGGFGVTRGGSTLMVWSDRSPGPAATVDALDSWSLTMLDLEGAM